MIFKNGLFGVNIFKNHLIDINISQRLPIDIDIDIDIFRIALSISIFSRIALGRGCSNRRCENLGIAKKGGGGSDLCQDFLVDL